MTNQFKSKDKVYRIKLEYNNYYFIRGSNFSKFVRNFENHNNSLDICGSFSEHFWVLKTLDQQTSRGLDLFTLYKNWKNLKKFEKLFENYSTK